MDDQYTLHIERKDIPLISIYYDYDYNNNIIENLKTISKEKIIQMQKKISEIGFQLQYSIPTLENNNTYYDNGYIDAVDKMLESLNKMK